jgi:hypothetical protein
MGLPLGRYAVRTVLLDVVRQTGSAIASEQPLRPWAGRQPKRRIGSSSSGVQAPLPEKSPRPWNRHKPPAAQVFEFCLGYPAVGQAAPRHAVG